MADEGTAAIGMDHLLTRLEKLESAMGSVTTQLSAIKTTEAILIEGVSNFRKFRLDAASSLGFLKGVAWVLGTLNTIALGYGGYMVNQAWPVIHAAVTEYYQHHPDARNQKSVLSPSGVYAVRLSPQLAGDPVDRPYQKQETR